MNNSNLIERYKYFAKNYYNKDDIFKKRCMDGQYRYTGFYDFQILEKYLCTKYCVNSKNPITIYADIRERTLSLTAIENEGEFEMLYIIYVNVFDNKQIELERFIDIYGKDFSKEYYKIMKYLKFPHVRYVDPPISMCDCCFCNNSDNYITNIVELYTNDRTLQKIGYQYCRFCVDFCTYSIKQTRVKALFKKLKNHAKIVGILIKFYNFITHKRYAPGGIGYILSKERFEKNNF